MDEFSIESAEFLVRDGHVATAQKCLILLHCTALETGSG
jgi:hypothetical protein